MDTTQGFFHSSFSANWASRRKVFPLAGPGTVRIIPSPLPRPDRPTSNYHRRAACELHPTIPHSGINRRARMSDILTSLMACLACRRPNETLTKQALTKQQRQPSADIPTAGPTFPGWPVSPNGKCSSTPETRHSPSDSTRRNPPKVFYMPGPCCIRGRARLVSWAGVSEEKLYLGAGPRVCVLELSERRIRCRCPRLSMAVLPCRSLC